MTDSRGLVISCPIEVCESTLRIKHPWLDPQELRFALLFWDQLDCPQNRVIAMDPGPDAAFLEKAGVLTRTVVPMPSSGMIADVPRLTLVGAFHILSGESPGAWSVATGERSISFLDEDLEGGRGALVQLHRVIPVPDKDVHLQDILDFRAKRRPELLALRHHLESIYGRVISAGDGELSWKSEAEALNSAVSDYLKSLKGMGMLLRLTTLEANLNVPGAAIAGILAQQANLTAVQTALAIGGASVSLKLGAALRKSPVTATPFRYVSAYHKELFPSG